MIGLYNMHNIHYDEAIKLSEFLIMDKYKLYGYKIKWAVFLAGG